MTDFLASVPFKRVSHIPVDARTTIVAQGVTLGLRPFTLTCLDEQPYPALVLLVGPAAGSTDTIICRVGLPALVGRILETAVTAAKLDEQTAAAVDVLRGALAGMEIDTTDSGTVNAIDLFGETLDQLIACAAHWRSQQDAKAAETP